MVSGIQTVEDRVWQQIRLGKVIGEKVNEC
jgi:hypothetical protein